MTRHRGAADGAETISPGGRGPSTRSEYVWIASQGERVLIADRDRVVAELVPPEPGRAERVSDAVLAGLVREGALRTLDALHLATALFLAARRQEIVVAAYLRTGARALGLRLANL